VRNSSEQALTWGPRLVRGLQVLLISVPFLGGSGPTVAAAPFVPSSDSEIVALVPAGATHTSLPQRMQATARLDVALPLAQFYIAQARRTGDLRFLGYAQALLTPWARRVSPEPQALILMATVLQSRHDFRAALTDLDTALTARPDDPQAWLTRATVLRVLGRYGEAQQSCQRLSASGDESVTALCVQSVRAVDGELASAYETTRALPTQTLTAPMRAWRYSQLGEMAEALGDDTAAAHWFGECLELTPEDMYTRAAYADLLLQQGQPAAVISLLVGFESMEPMLLRLAIAQRLTGSPGLAQSRPTLQEAFNVEEQRGEAVHRREQARFLLDVLDRPIDALRVAQLNWQVQREPDDVLILLRAARAAGRPGAASDAPRVVTLHQKEDARIAPYLHGAT
jgi:tetratricopeptide (TPR) repeat protein